jgi:hypothetical protein
MPIFMRKSWDLDKLMGLGGGDKGPKRETPKEPAPKKEKLRNEQKATWIGD